MKAKKKKKEGGGGAPGWMVTYGDMMSLLLTFFVMLLSYSSTDIFKFKQAMGSLRGALGVMKSEQGVVNLPKMMIGTRAPQQVETSSVRLRKLIKQEHLEDAIRVERTDKGLLIRISSPVLFDLGKAEVKPDIRSILGKLVDIISKWEGPVRVEGHTDDLHCTEYPCEKSRAKPAGGDPPRDECGPSRAPEAIGAGSPSNLARGIRSTGQDEPATLSKT
jgi:chemotaxis protein MotB